MIRSGPLSFRQRPLYCPVTATLRRRNRMQVYHEMPLFALEDGTEQVYTDGSYALVHLFEDPDIGERYFSYFAAALRSGRSVILDNSIFELGTAFEPVRFVYWLKRLVRVAGTADTLYYVIPDVLDDYQGTIASIDSFRAKNPGLPGTAMVVAQGHTLEALMQCFVDLKSRVNIRENRIGISFNCLGYHELISSEERAVLLPEQYWALARIRFIWVLGDERLLGTSEDPPYIHLLGAGVPQEFRAYTYEYRRFIASLDTSNPVVHGLSGISYTENGLQQKQKQLLAEWMGEPAEYFGKERVDLMKSNMVAFRKLNRL